MDGGQHACSYISLHDAGMPAASVTAAAAGAAGAVSDGHICLNTGILSKLLTLIICTGNIDYNVDFISLYEFYVAFTFIPLFSSPIS